MEDKEKIIIDGVDVSQCEFYIYYSSDRYPHRCGMHKDMFGMPACCDVADCCKNCYFKQLQEEKFENLNNRQIVESAENLIYENSELIKNLEEKKQECEKLKKQLMQKTEVDMFFNTPIEGWSNDPCGICPHKAENEELKKEIINKNEKIKELRFSVSDLTNRLCYLNAEKSFRIVDLEQALDEIAAHYQKVIKNITTYDDSYDASISIEALHNISDIINKAKGGK